MDMKMRWTFVVFLIFVGNSSISLALQNGRHPRVTRVRTASSGDGTEGEPTPLVVLRAGGGFLSAILPARTQLRETPDKFSGAFVDDGETVFRVESREASESSGFTRVRTRSGAEGLIRTTHLQPAAIAASVSIENEVKDYVDEIEWQPPAWLEALERQSKVSAARRKDAEASTRLQLESLADALRPLEVLFGGPGSLVDDDARRRAAAGGSSLITFRGWCAVLFAGGFPLYASIALSQGLLGAVGLGGQSSRLSPTGRPPLPF